MAILNISDNKIDDKGFKSFGDVSLKNHVLENLDVSKNMISVTNKPII
jgi:Leucine-rich repeat (LRR) protein